MAKPNVSSVLFAALDLLQIAFALVVIAITAWKLLNVDINIGETDFSSKCLLDGSKSDDALSGTRLCAYAIAVGVISLLVSIIFACIRNCVKCITLNACGANKIVSVVGDAALAVWWGIAFAILVRRGTAANNLNWPEKTARDGVIAASFGALAAFGIDCIGTIVSLIL